MGSDVYTNKWEIPVIAMPLCVEHKLTELANINLDVKFEVPNNRVEYEG